MSRRPRPPRGARPVVFRPRELRERGHRGEQTPRDAAPRRRDRKESALADISAHRAVAYADVVDVHFDGHPYAARASVNQLKAEGLVTEHEASGPGGGTFSVLAATRAGAQEARAAGARFGYAEDQHFWSGLGRRDDLAHDVAVYRAVLEARAQLSAQGIAATRVRLDPELRRLVAGRSERVRARQGRKAADAERRRAAHELQLPLTSEGNVAYPDAQLEYALSEANGHPTFGRVNIEVTTEHYSRGAIAAKTASGFALYGSTGKAARLLGKFFREATKSAGHRRGRDPRPPESMEL